ncbi:MAG: hypothetical protein K6G10_04430 [Butyrivibrio sp.]|nr:hypothetical protein [Butyrivibrio sp.]
MSDRRNSRLSLFLMELIIAIFFFSLASAVCVRLFVGAHVLSRKSEDVSMAVIWSQNLSEVFWNTKGDVEKMHDAFPGSTSILYENKEKEGTLILLFNSDWEIISSSDSGIAYEAMIDIERKSAAEVYSDVTDYGVTLVGEAKVAHICIADMSGFDDILTIFPQTSENIILSNDVDLYIGEEVL